MSVTITLRCDTTGCTVAHVATETTLADARIGARLAGWHSARQLEEGTARYTTRDQCPAHAPATPYDGSLPPSAGCARAPWPCKDSTLAHLFGHDQLGHRIANVLAREGFLTREQVAAADDATFLDMRGIGGHALARIRYVVGGGDHGGA